MENTSVSTFENEIPRINRSFEDDISVFDFAGAYQVKSVCNTVFGVYVPVVICTFGIVGCIVSFVVLWKVKNQKNPFIFLFKALVLSDGFYLFLFLFCKGLWKLYIETGSSILAPVYKYSSYIYIEIWFSSVESLSSGMSVCNLTLLCLARYFAVCRPFKVKQLVTLNRARVGVLLGVAYGIVTSIPYLFLDEIVTVKNGNVSQIFKRVTENGSNVYFQTFCLFFNYMAENVIGVGILGFATFKIIGTLNSAKKKRKEMTSKKSTVHKSNSGITLTLILNASFFIVSRIFGLGTYLVFSYRLNVPRLDFICVWKIQETFIFMSSAVDVILFTVCCKEFRDILFKPFRHLIH